MSLEGGRFICYRHDFETDSVKTWDRHCYEFKHTLDAVQQCPKCKEWIVDHKFPMPERYVERSHANNPDDKVIVLKCQNCESLNNEV